ncbi:YjcZ family sporulation protein [Bacillus sp. FJAT-45037]|nr:YjcZ family sporulation protein [Bacillus sp. FJAT-45037]
MSKQQQQHGHYESDNGFTILVILFILLVIVGATFYC